MYKVVHSFPVRRRMALFTGCVCLVLTILACAIGPTVSDEPDDSSVVTQPQTEEPVAPSDSEEVNPSTGEEANNMDVVDGILYTRQDTYDPSMGSAFSFDTEQGIATYYQFWTPGTCEVDTYQVSSMPYEYEDGYLTLPNMDPIPVTGDPPSFSINLPGGTSGEPQEGISGPNMVVVNGINGTYTETECPSP